MCLECGTDESRDVNVRQSLDIEDRAYTNFFSQGPEGYNPQPEAVICSAELNQLRSLPPPPLSYFFAYTKRKPLRHGWSRT